MREREERKCGVYIGRERAEAWSRCRTAKQMEGISLIKGSLSCLRVGATSESSKWTFAKVLQMSKKQPTKV